VTRPRSVSALVLCAALLAGCGTASGPLPSGSAAAHGAASSAGASEAAHRRLADRATATLLAAVALPPGTVATTTGPAALASQAPGPMDGAVHRHRTWRVAAPVAQVRTWFRDHPPKGLSDSGSGGSVGRDSPDVSSWYWFLNTSGDLRDAVDRADLTVSVVPTGRSSTAVRADAVALWLVPTPRRDDGTDGGATAFRLTTSTPCPTIAAAGGIGTVANPGDAGAGLDAALLPDAVPVGGVACLYGADDLGGTGDRSARHTLTAEQAADVAATARRLVLGHTVLRSVHSCPLPPVRLVLVDLVYADGREVDLLASPVCGGVRNGRIVVDRNLDVDWRRWVRWRS
jgi:hypothetical protein